MRKVRAPRVSVIVPSYNVASYLERALDSALTQTVLDLEILVVDDSSEDTTLQVARRVAARDARVRVLKNERNSGPSVSRNRAISAAKGEWIALLDGDDEWLPERLERMLAYGDKADIICDDVYIVHKPSEKRNKYEFSSLLQEKGLPITEPRQLSLLDFIRYDLGLAKPIIRRSLIERHQLAYDPAVLRGEDFLFLFEALVSGARWLQLPRGYYLYLFGRAGSLAFDRHTLWQDMIENVQPLLAHPAVARDATVAATLERFLQRAHNILVVDTFQNMVHRRDYTKIVQLLLKQPSAVFLIMKTYVRRSRFLRLLARRYRLTEYCNPLYVVRTALRVFRRVQESGSVSSHNYYKYYLSKYRPFG